MRFSCPNCAYEGLFKPRGDVAICPRCRAIVSSGQASGNAGEFKGIVPRDDESRSIYWANQTLALIGEAFDLFADAYLRAWRGSAQEFNDEVLPRIQRLAICKARRLWKLQGREWFDRVVAPKAASRLAERTPKWRNKARHLYKRRTK